MSARADDSVVSVADASIYEGSGNPAELVFAVTVSGAASATVSVAYATVPCTAAEGWDYAGVNGVLVFSGETAQEVRVPVFDDLEAEGTEALWLRLFDAAGAVLVRDQALGLVHDDDRSKEYRPRGDANGDGRSDVFVFYEIIDKLGGKPSGRIVVWDADAQTVTPQPPPEPALGSEGELAASDGGALSEPVLDSPPELAPETQSTLTLVGSGDFSGDGEPDVLWWDAAAGTLSIWVETAPGVGYAEAPEPTSAAPGWQPVATGDFDGDGSPDVLWRDDASGALSLWRMDGTKRIEATVLKDGSPSPGSQVVAVGDFDGDGDEDLLWQEPSQELLMWFLQDGALVCGDHLHPRTLELAGTIGWEVDGPR